MIQNKQHPVAIIGGGPIGLAAAAHLSERKISFVLFEAGPGIGANVQHWQHVQVFSPWQYNIDAAAERLLKQQGWQPPHAGALPTGAELLASYLKPLAALPSIRPYLYLNSRVVAITRQGYNKTKTFGRNRAPLLLKVKQGDTMISFAASAIIDASGTWQNPNPMGASGLPAQGEKEHQAQIFYGIPDIQGSQRARYAGKAVAVVGSGHSAINALLALAKLQETHSGTQIHWVLSSRNLSRIFGGRENDQLEARGALGQQIEALVKANSLTLHNPFFIESVDTDAGKLKLSGTKDQQTYNLRGIDEIIVATGARPDLTLTREIRVAYDEILECVPRLRELIDPNIHSCGTVPPHGEAMLRQPEENYYVVGMKSYGRAPSFLMATGYEQVRSVVAYLAGDLEAAGNVALSLPETGVCSTTNPTEAETACCSSSPDLKNPVASCCGGPAVSSPEACCLLDEQAKAEGQTGCGCQNESGHSELPAATVSKLSCC